IAQREAEQAASLLSLVNTPHIARLLEVIPETLDLPMSLMYEYVDGMTLTDYIITEHGGQLPVEEAVLIARQILVGLAAAHNEGVLHRDLHPRNVMISWIKGELVATILDFGMAAPAVRGAPNLYALSSRTFEPIHPFAEPP